MFYLIIGLSSFLFYRLYIKYFIVDLKIIIGYLIGLIAAFLIKKFNNDINSLFFYYIFSFFYLSIITDIKEQWISDLTILMISIINFLKAFISKVVYGKQIYFSGLIFMSVIIVIILLLEVLTKKELMGMGDLKLFFVLSINVDIPFCIIMLMLSSLLGIFYYFLYYKNKVYFPFGPAIMISYLIMYIIKIGLE